MNKKKELLVRVYLVMFFFIAFALMILWRIGQIAIVEGDELRSKVDKYMKWVNIEAERGSIYADDGSTLVSSLKFFEIRMDPTVSKKRLYNKEVDSLCYYLEKYSDIKKSRWQWKKLLDQSRKDNNRWVLVAKRLNFDLCEKFKSFPLFKYHPNVGGMIVTPISRREKPFKELASRTIGLNRATADKVGLEAYHDHQLKGDSVPRLLKLLPGKNWVQVFEPEEVESKNGADLYTTLDIELQDIVHHELLNAVQYQDAKMATAVIMDVESGAIKAISNFTKNKNGYYEESYNHAIGRSSEPGSTFKLATTLALLESGDATPNTMVDLHGGKKKFYDQWMHDSHPHHHREVTLADVIVKSSNVGIGTLAHKAFGKKNKRPKFYNQLQKMGLTQKTGIELIGERNPYIKNPEKENEGWSGTTAPWMAHGYELKMTPLQILNFYNAIANGGRLMKPFLVNEIVKNGEVLKKYESVTLVEQIASKENINHVKRMLEDVVLKGTATNIKSDKYDFAGKTGTASTNYASEQNETKKYNASFVGYFPAEKPQYSMIVVMYDPKTEYYGNKAAGTVFKAIADRVFALDRNLSQSVEYASIDDKEHLPKDGYGASNDFRVLLSYLDMDFKQDRNAEVVNLRSAGSKVHLKRKQAKENTIPDVRGMGLKDAIYVLENLGVKVAPFGVGKVERQNILPGTKINGQEIEIFLN